jgi:transcriptional regulator with XRE-family HTH domain
MSRSKPSPSTATRRDSAGVEINGALLRQLRKLTGDNLKVFAPKAQISVGYLSQIELGERRTVSPAAYERIYLALGVPKTRLLAKRAP